MPPHQSNHVNNEAYLAFTVAVAQAVADLLPTLTTPITDGIRQNENNGNNGTQEEQAKHFKWGLNDFVLDMILNIEFTDVAQVANAVRNIEIFYDRSKNKGDNKRDRDGHRIRPSETSSQRSNPRADDRRDSDIYDNHGRHGNMDIYGTDRWRGDRQDSDRHSNGSDRQGNGNQKAWRDQDQ
nr:zinc finger, CCHC-type, retrotransposon Gag domain protein [Tanacetum cinerariifolium]